MTMSRSINPNHHRQAILARIFKTVLTGMVLIPVTGHADEYHYNNMLIGSRAAGMGGAYTAISDDPTGLYYNPAGIVYTAGANFSGNMNAFHRTTIRYKGVVGGLYDWTRESTTVPPNFFGFTQPMGKGVFGFSVAVPDSILEDQDQTFQNFGTINKYIINFNNQDNTYYGGPSYARKFSEDVSLGMTLYVHYRTLERIQNQILKFSNGDYEWLNLYYATQELGLRPLLGVMWSPVHKASIGITLSKTLSYLLSSQSQQQNNIILWDSSSSSFASGRKENESQTPREFPLTLTLGGAYFWSDSLLVSGDVSFNTATNDGKETTWNIALGSEYYVTRKWAVRAGFFTNRANTPELRNDRLLQDPHVDMYGGSLSIGYFTRNSALSFGLNYSFGRGYAQLFKNLYTLQDIESQAYTVFVTSTVSY